MIEARGPDGINILWGITFSSFLVFITSPNTFPITLPLTVLIFLISLGATKRIQMTSDGCTVKTLFSKRFYRWSALQTMRYMDFEKPVIQTLGPDYKHLGKWRTDYGPGILFSTRRLGKYPNTVPETYFLFRDPLCLTSFYIHLLPENDFYEWSDGYKKTKFYAYPVKREEFISKAVEWGLKIEGLNVPMPPEQLASKKRR